MVTFNGDASLCDGLSDDFDLLSYAESCNDGQLSEPGKSLELSLSERSTTAALDELLSCNDLLESETQFTRLKRRPCAFTQQYDSSENSDSSPPTDDLIAGLSLKKEARRDGLYTDCVSYHIIYISYHIYGF